MSDDSLADWIELLCGQAPTPTKYSSELIRHFPKGGLGRSQLNEILLAYQLDRIGEGLFEFIFGNEPIQDFETFKTKISEFRIFGAVHCGNFKFAYKSLRQRSLKEIRDIFRLDEPDPETAFRKRHPPVVALNEIDPKDTYYLGYIIERQLKEHPDEGASKRMMEIREKGAINHEIYLDYDHLDVYIATSMREKFDFWNIARFARELQCREEIGALNLRYFDPTQAYCKDRIDKGLVEGLMLKRAKCTIYLAGETETLGKDSELAATLAQGKTVIAYVPSLEDFDKFRIDFVEKVFAEVYPEQKKIEVALRFLQHIWPVGAWQSDKVRQWVQSRDESLAPEVVREVYERAKALYDGRAQMLKETHPLGLQVHLETGVANGVLVARTVPECARLLKKVVLNRLEFRLEKKGSVYAAVETSTGSIYRVVTGDSHLTNSFWNFYKY